MLKLPIRTGSRQRSRKTSFRRRKSRLRGDRDYLKALIVGGDLNPDIYVKGLVETTAPEDWDQSRAVGTSTLNRSETNCRLMETKLTCRLTT